MATRRNRYKENPYGVYHILIRGSRTSLELFRDSEDVDLYKDILMRFRKDGLVIIYAVSMFGNYCHLLVKEGSISIPEFKKKLANMYYKHYNIKYNHSGNVFRDHAETQSVMTRNFFSKCISVMNLGNAMMRVVFQDSLDELDDRDYQDDMEVVDFGSRSGKMNFKACLIYVTSELGYKGQADFRAWPDDRKTDFIARAMDAGVTGKFISRLTELSCDEFMRK